ncbi:MAG TPA: DUF4139 domain-containing protein [Chitinophagales bacterium]|nr:DUF4139 domain-containing protein [Chitinophagales bacterium]
MKRIGILILSIFVLTFQLPLCAQKSIEATASIKSVTVYLQGAEILLRSNVTVPSGSSDIVFTNLPQSVNASTIQVSANTDLTILSAVFQLNYLTSKKENVQVQLLKDSLELLSMQLKKVAGQKVIVKGQMDLLNANKNVAGQNTGLSMDQLTKMYDFYATKMNELNNQQLELEQKEKKLNENYQRVQNQLNELNSKFNQPTGEIVVSVTSKISSQTTFEITFLLPDAGWSPIYDIRSKDVHSNVTLNYKANVYQNSGTDWKDVMVKLSTGNPTVSATGPLITPWYLDFYHPMLRVNANAPSQQLSNMALPQGKSERLVEKDQNYEAASSSGADYTTVVQTQLTAEFSISIPYDIPSDGKPHLIAIQDYDLPAAYHYYAVPKLDNDAFLIADISAWEDLNLLPGNANIFFQGSYVGQSYLDPLSTKDTLPISLGRDRSIVIKREKVKDFSKEKIIGENKKQSFSYTINVKNTKKEAVDIKLIDQYPISQQGKIEVTLDDGGGATVVEAAGKLIWILHLESNEEKKVQFTFTVKYPKDQVIGGL